MRILIAEDDLVSRKMLQATLARWGFEAIACVDGLEALAVLQSNDTPEIAILDWMMPQMDGPEVCRRVRALPTRHPKYIILLTAKAQREDLIAGLQAGADDYVTKPFDPRELHARLNVGIRVVGLQNDLADKVDELEIAMARLAQNQQSQKLEAIGRLASGVAHEINSPLQYIGDNVRFLKNSWEALEPAIKLLVELPRELRAEVDPMEVAARIEARAMQGDVSYALAEVPGAVSQTIEGIERVTRIVRAMRDFSHPSDEHKSKVDLNRAIEATLTVSRNEWKYVAAIETEFDPTLAPVNCLPAEIQQVVLNLLINASHSIARVVGKSGRLGTIKVATEGHPDFVEIRISDTGCGIPNELHDKVFEPFFTTKDVGEGTGQGLSIARSVVVQQHGGKIWFESKVGKGTTFFLQLPLAGSEEENNGRHEIQNIAGR